MTARLDMRAGHRTRGCKEAEVEAMAEDATIIMIEDGEVERMAEVQVYIGNRTGTPQSIQSNVTDVTRSDMTRHTAKRK